MKVNTLTLNFNRVVPKNNLREFRVVKFLSEKIAKRKQNKKYYAKIRINHRIPIRTYMDNTQTDKTRTTFEQFRILTYVAIKRIFDTSVATIGLITLSPAIITIAILIKLDSSGPIFFTQLRTGKFGKEFNIIKFRTMSKNNDVLDFNKKDQVTKIGKILRKTSLDEIPQLLNVVKQDMAIIGPRPWIPEYYKHMNAKQRRRYDVRPGITGLAQCSGRNDLTIEQKIDYDRQYIHHYSLKQDISVIIKTIKCILNGSGIGDGKSTIEQEINELKSSHLSRRGRES